MSKKSTTAWSAEKSRPRGGGSSLTSDLLAPRRTSPAPPPKQSKGPKAQSAATTELLKSHEVKRLEKLIDEVSTGVVGGRAASQPGCFCTAKSHPLSPYVPLCVHCGIILCSLHNPALPCPSCSSPLLPPATRNALLAQLQDELAIQLAKEAEKRAEEMRILREAELARSGGGHFPTLTGQPDNKPVQASLPRKVLSLNSTTKKATISTFIAVPTPPTSNPASGRASPVEDRVPAPGQTPEFVDLDPELKLLLRQRPWVDLKDPTPMYVPPPKAQPASGEQSGGGRGRGRGKRGRGGQNLGFNDRVVPGAGPS